MPRPPRFIPPGMPVECTTRTVQRRLLLTPSPEINDLVLGVFGRALHKAEFEGIKLHGFIVFTNHIELTLTPSTADVLARFMCFINSNIARRVGQSRGWRSKFWGRRYKPIAIVDDGALVGRMRYMLAHGCKEGFVRRPRDWPGATCLPTLVSGAEIKGTWYDLSAMGRDRRRGKMIVKEDYATHYTVPLTPIPSLEGQPAEEQQAFYRDMVADIERETQEKNRDEGWSARGPAWICRQDPFTTPSGTTDTPAPLCHATERQARRSFLMAYREFVFAYREAVARMKAGEQGVRFPPNSFPPGQPFLPPP
jgi:hypothetical protein